MPDGEELAAASLGPSIHLFCARRGLNDDMATQALMEVGLCAAILTEPFLLKLPLFLPVHVLQFAFLSAAHLILQSPHLARVRAHEVFISSLTTEVALEEGQRSPPPVPPIHPKLARPVPRSNTGTTMAATQQRRRWRS